MVTNGSVQRTKMGVVVSYIVERSLNRAAIRNKPEDSADVHKSLT